MLLTTLQCAAARCENEFTEEVPRWHLLLFARDAGWTSSDDEELFWCPEHGPDSPGTRDKWVVGCWTCGFEEEFDSQEEAESEHSFHECEADTWIWTPEQVREKEARRASRRTMETVTVNAALSDAAAKQERIEGYANRWLRIRNVFLFWNKQHIE